MARPLRIEFAGAVYHVMAQGNQGRPIFADDPDRKRWLEILGETCQKTGWRIHAYVLMGPYIHLNPARSGLIAWDRKSSSAIAGAVIPGR